MKLNLYQVDAFTHQVFKGNPAAVCSLTEWLPDHVMQSIAAENNLAETAFFVATDTGFHIRWFTPTVEVDLCGHATLASAHVLFEHLNFRNEKVIFSSRSGDLIVKKIASGYQMDFPNQTPFPCDKFNLAEQTFGRRPVKCLCNQDYVIVFDDETFVREFEPDFGKLKEWDLRGVTITAKSDEYDFVSRFFAPNYGIDEDPVTGSSFTQLAPYWAEKLDKNQLKAKQVSNRGGEVLCEVKGNRVLLSGDCVTYLMGEIHI